MIEMNPISTPIYFILIIADTILELMIPFAIVSDIDQLGPLRNLSSSPNNQCYFYLFIIGVATITTIFTLWTI